METVTAKTKQRTTARGRLEVERRWVIRDIGWDDYEELGKLLPPTFRLAFDGSSLEIMVTGQLLHDDYADALDTFFKAVAGALGVQFTKLNPPEASGLQPMWLGGFLLLGFSPEKPACRRS